MSSNNVDLSIIMYLKIFTNSQARNYDLLRTLSIDTLLPLVGGDA